MADSVANVKLETLRNYLDMHADLLLLEATAAVKTDDTKAPAFTDSEKGKLWNHLNAASNLLDQPHLDEVFRRDLLMLALRRLPDDAGTDSTICKWADSSVGQLWTGATGMYDFILEYAKEMFATRHSVPEKLLADLERAIGRATICSQGLHENTSWMLNGGASLGSEVLVSRAHFTRVLVAWPVIHRKYKEHKDKLQNQHRPAASSSSGCLCGRPGCSNFSWLQPQQQQQQQRRSSPVNPGSTNRPDIGSVVERLAAAQDDMDV